VVATATVSVKLCGSLMMISSAGPLMQHAQAAGRLAIAFAAPLTNPPAL
jgi:hypothetical protein